VPITGSQKALMFCRSGLARSGATRSDYYLPYLALKINGVDRTLKVWKHSLRVENVLSEQVDTAQLAVYGFTPVAGQTITVGSGAFDNLVFAGTIARTHQRSVRGFAQTIHDLECVDYTWTLNKRRVFKTYPAGMGISLAAADVVTSYAAGFSTGKIKPGAPSLTGDLVFRGTSVMDALQRLAQTAGWRCYPDYDKVVHFYDTETEQAPQPLQVGNYLYDGLDYTLDISEIQTRVYGVGGGAQTTAVVNAGATTIPVNECGWYDAAGGKILHGGEIITYTGRSAASGAGDITGVTGAILPIQLGDTVNVFVQKDDSAAQTALAALIGGGDDGIREGWVEDGRWSLATTGNQAQAQLNAYRNTDVRGSYTTYDKVTRAGKQVTLNIAARGISSVNVTLQRVTRRMANPNKWVFDASFSVTWSDLVDILSRTLGA